MLGFSIFLTDELNENKIKYIKKMKEKGFSGVFTSVHIPEEDPSYYIKRLKKLGDICKKLSLELMVDISGTALNKVGLSFENTKVMKNWGITGLRMDYDISNRVIAEVSRSMKIGLNASTFTQMDYKELRMNQAQFNNMEMWHNYYPRENTGLDKQEFKKKNQWLKSLGFTVIAFVPGDKELRGPLKKTLPTVEEHRQKHPLACAIDLLKNGLINQVYIGDPEIYPKTIEQFNQWYEKDVMVLFVEKVNHTYQDLVLKTHCNRQDAARDVFRSDSARFDIGNRVIEPLNCVARTLGSVTLDNKLYGRYMGEFQIVKKYLEADERVNVVGNVIEEDLPLLSYITSGIKIELRIEEKKLCS